MLEGDNPLSWTGLRRSSGDHGRLTVDRVSRNHGCRKGNVLETEIGDGGPVSRLEHRDAYQERQRKETVHYAGAKLRGGSEGLVEVKRLREQYTEP